MTPAGLPVDVMATLTRPVPGPDMTGRASLRPNGEIERTAQDFEAMALHQMLNFMMSEIDLSDTPFGGGMGERAFQPFLVEEYAKGFSQAGGIGIADAVRSEMLKIQEAAQGGAQG